MRSFCVSVLAFLLLLPAPALALNRQGQPTAPGDDAELPPLMNFSGYAFAGGLFYNPSYAARPDNSGRALLRVGLHADLDLFRKYLTVTYDANVFTDRDSPQWYRPSEHDHIVGLLARWRMLEAATHYEADLPADRPGAAQSYVDVHARWYFNVWTAFPALRHALPHQGLWGFVTLAGFVYNPTYAARPDLSGLALLRYAGHLELDLYRPWITISVDLNFFTARESGYGLVPSELDTTIGLTAHLGPVDLSIVAENDRPLDRQGLQQSYASLMAAYHFDIAQSFFGRRR